jgi:RNA 3'-terminal phosphate cyclase (ATP)
MPVEIEIDGSQGEGGGQILRSSLTLSLVTGTPVKISNIRAGRDKPGLMRQHLTAVRAAAEVGDAQVEGDAVGSQSLSFMPHAIKAGSYSFSVGTAGSGTLVLQTVLPALMIADAPSDITVEGGTHNQWAPPYDFLADAYFPILNRMGVRVTSGLERHGFYPAGGGRFSVGIEPVAGSLAGVELLERGEILHRSFTAIVAHLPRSIAQRELDVAAEKLGWSPSCFHLHDVRNSQGPGNVIIAEMHSEHLREVFTGFGRQGARAERVANEVVDQLRDYLASTAPVGRHLADQLLLPLGIAAWRDGAVSRFKTLPLTRHSSTHIAILRVFLGVPIDVHADRGVTTVSIG